MQSFFSRLLVFAFLCYFSSSSFAQSCGSGGGATVCLTATASGSNIVLSWTVTGTITSVEIYRDTDSNPSGRSRIASVSTTTTSYTDTAVVAGTPYWYWIKFRASNTFYNSNAATATVASCSPTAITPYIYVNGAWSQGSSATINSGNQIILGPQPVSGGSWSWSGCGTSGSSREQTISPTSSCTATSVYTNSCGATSSQNFNITVSTTAATPLPMPTKGFNLGNTLEATWGVPTWNTAIFSTAANAGFNAVRIPCAWDFNSNASTHQINSAYMAQVKSAVDAALAAGLYVVINDHWDDGWLENNIGTSVDSTIDAKMNSYWTQIANAFAGYDNHLLFAGANEPNISSPANMTTLMHYYQTFINAVRATGGNNTNRWLVLQSVSEPSWMTNLPTDPTPGRLMVEYHQYTPSLFTIIHTDQTWGNAIYFWGLAYHYSGNASRNATWGEEVDIDSFFQQLVNQYVSKGIPAMIGEFGAYSAGLTGTDATYNNASVLYWDKYVAESARAHGLSPFYWSTPNSPFTWSTGAVSDSQLISVLTGGAAPPPPNGSPTAASNLVATTTGTGQITLSWSAGPNATSYKLYRAAESGYESTVAAVVTGITGTSYVDNGLNPGTTYYYQIAAVNSSGSSGYSAEAHATTSGVNPDPTKYNFETDPQRWTVGSGSITGIATSTTQHYAGNRSLAVNINATAAGTSDIYVSSVVVPAGGTITFHVWIPAGSTITAVNPYLQDYNWNSSSTSSGTLTPNAWNTITLTVPSNDTTPLQRLDIPFTTSGAWTGTVYIDSINWN